MTFRLIGYWKSDRQPDQPDPATLVDESWNEDERHVVAMYYSRGTIARSFMGYSPCRLCGVNNGAVEYTDGVYAWPEGFVHYIEDHGVRPPADVVEHALKMMDAIEAAKFDLSSWVSQTRPSS